MSFKIFGGKMIKFNSTLRSRGLPIQLISSLALFAILGLSACTKEKIIDETGLQNDKVTGLGKEPLKKSDFTGCVVSALTSGSCPEAKEYIVVRAITEADGNNFFGAIPGFHGEYGVVKAQIRENELVFYSSSDHIIGRDYYGVSDEVIDINNPNIVLSFGIDKHFDIIREKNDYGEETNKMVESEERPILQREFMRVNFSNVTSRRFKIANQLWSDLVLNEEDSSLTSPVIKHEDGSIEINLESRITSSYWSSRSFRIQTKTTLIPVPSSDYQALEYSDEDWSKYGFFRSTKYKNSPEKALLDKDVDKMAMKFNVCEPGTSRSCSSNKIVYHLTHDMPQNYADLSEKAVKAWNRAFQQALGRTDDVVVLDKTKTVDAGDVRHNVIAHVDTDFSDGGLLGVAQFVTHPFTGETLSARATVYEDGISSSVGALDLYLNQIIVQPETLVEFLKTGELKTLKATASNVLAAINEKSQAEGAIQLHKKLQQAKVNGLDAPLSNLSHLKMGMNVDRSRKTQSLRNQVSRLGDVAKNKAAWSNIVSAKSNYSKLSEKFQNFDVKSQQLDKKNNINLLQKTQPKDMLSSLQIMTTGKLKDESGLELTNSSQLHFEDHRLHRLEEMGIHTSEMLDESVIRYVQKELIRIISEGLDLGDDVEENQKEIIARLESGDVEAIREVLIADLEGDSSIREQMKTELAGRVFYTTLLHEMGHDFGLRHNFRGSVDLENFHPKFFELAQRINEGDKSVSRYDLEEWAFSSVMDYNGAIHNDMEALGKYDVAAIRYAYNAKQRQIEGESHQFCTDDHTYDDLMCNRFDRGITLSEITNNRVQSYKRRYFTSFFRRGKASFYDPSYGLAMRFMMPIRQVLDERIYSMITSPGAPPQLQSQTKCSDLVTAISVYYGEFKVNPCDNVELESNGINPMNLGELDHAVDLTKPINAIVPMGMADLIISGIIAKNFFSEIIGSPDTGAYLVEQESANTPIFLTKLEGVLPKSEYGENTAAYEQNVVLALRLLASDRNLDPISFAEIAKGYVTNVDYGAGKPLMTRSENIFGEEKVTTIGSIWEKVYAMLIMGTRYVGVPKYYSASLFGNAYLWPHTKDFALNIASTMIQKKSYLVSQEVEVPAMPGVKLPALVPVAQDKNTQNIAAQISIIDYIDNEDKSFGKKVNVMSGVDQCAQDEISVKVKVAGETLCAVEHFNKDSIVVPMLKTVETEQKQLAKWESILVNEEEISNSVIALIHETNKVDEGALPVAKNIVSSFNKLEELKELTSLLLGDNSFLADLEIIQSMPTFTYMMGRDLSIQEKLIPVNQKLMELRSQLEVSDEDLAKAVEQTLKAEADKAGVKVNSPAIDGKDVIGNSKKLLDMVAKKGFILAGTKKVAMIPVTYSKYDSSKLFMAQRNRENAEVVSMNSERVKTSESGQIIENLEKVSVNDEIKTPVKKEDVIAASVAFTRYLDEALTIVDLQSEVKIAAPLRDITESKLDRELAPLLEVKTIYDIFHR